MLMSIIGFLRVQPLGLKVCIAHEIIPMTNRSAGGGIEDERPIAIRPNLVSQRGRWVSVCHDISLPIHRKWRVIGLISLFSAGPMASAVTIGEPSNDGGMMCPESTNNAHGSRRAAAWTVIFWSVTRSGASRITIDPTEFKTVNSRPRSGCFSRNFRRLRRAA
jgi:hypothetical protein